MTYYVSSGTLNPTHSLTHLQHMLCSEQFSVAIKACCATVHAFTAFSLVNAVHIQMDSL